MTKKILFASLIALSTALAGTAHARDGKEVYDQTCVACHLAGASGAPKLTDKEAWAPRIEKGMDALMNSALNGIEGTAMMPRGTCNNCSDEELRAAVEYMVEQAK